MESDIYKLLMYCSLSLSLLTQQSLDSGQEIVEAEAEAERQEIQLKQEEYQKMVARAEAERKRQEQEKEAMGVTWGMSK